MAIFTGAGVAIITPFHEDGSINYDQLKKLVDYHCENGTDSIVICGTTGESATMTEEEHLECIKRTIDFTAGRIPVIAGTGSNCTATAVELSREAAKAGADGLLVVTPYYNKATQKGLIEHYKAIAREADAPIIMYSVASRTGCNIEPATVAALVKEVDNIVGVKEASGNITQMDDIIKNKPENFNVISGDDGITFPLITLGAVGVISVIGNAFPREFSRMTRLALQGDFANALAIHHRFTELFNLLFVDGNPAGVKSMLNAMGMIENKLRLPLVPTRITTFEAIRKVLNELNIKC